MSIFGKTFFLAVLLCLLVSCAGFNQLLKDLDSTFINPEPPVRTASPTALAAEPAGATKTAVAPASARIPPRSVVLNRPGTARDVSQYRTDTPLPGAAALARSRPAAAVKSAQDLRNLAQSLVRLSDDPFLQVKALHDWTALVLRYDAAAYFSKSIPDQSWPFVLERGRAVCEGYANVLDELLRISGFPTIKVHGYARGAGHDNTRQPDPTESNHAWNLVRIYDHWYLLDATWDSGHLDGRTVKQDYSTAYFLLKPEGMIHTHFPGRPEWQLLEQPLTAQQFINLPDFRGNFFDIVNDGYQKIALYNTVEKPAILRLGINPGYRLSANLYDAGSGREENAVFAQQADGICSLYLAPSAGRWILRLFAAPNGTTRYSSIGELIIESSNTTQVSTPVLYGDFHTHNARIHAPLLQSVHANTTQYFEFYIENISAAFIVVNRQQYQLENNGPNLYSINLNLPKTAQLDIFIKKSGGSNRQSGLLSFPVLP